MSNNGLLLFYFSYILFGFDYPHADLPAPRKYIAYKTSSELSIDGQAEAAWDLALWSDFFIDIEGEKKPKYQTRVKMLWDDTYLYFYAELEEPHVWGNIDQRDKVIFHNNDFEIFIDPDGDTHHYMEFEINALNTVWDLLLTKPYRNDPQVVDSWDIAGLKTAVHVSGTLNNPKDEDKGWSVEVAMPWGVLTEHATHRGVPKEEYWRINFSRVNWDFVINDQKYSRQQDEKGNILPEYNWVWSPQGVINMHEPEHWGYVYFLEEERSSDSFELPEDEKLKWRLYETYRNIRQRADNREVEEIGFVKIESKVIPVNLEYHQAGWNIWMVSPYTGQKLLLKEDGQLKIIK